MKYWPVAIVFLLAVSIVSASAAEFHLGASLSSTNFRVLDAQHAAFGGTASSSSSSFRLLTSIGDLAIGSSSVTSFAIRSGFLYFPSMVAPTLTSATDGDGEVALVWLDGQALGGLSIGSYTVCTSSGTYTCQNVASVTSYTKTGLTNGTSYTFKIQANDALGNVIADSNELSATPAESEVPTSTPGSGGGGGGYASQILSKITFIGRTDPQATVVVLRDALRITESKANSAGKFTIENKNVAPGTYKYTLYAVDTNGHRSANLSILVSLKTNEEKVLDQLVLLPIQSGALPGKRMFDIPGCGILEFPDLGCDGRVDIVDISILMFHYKRLLVPSMKFMDFNSDETIDIIDFSILVFHWTG